MDTPELAIVAADDSPIDERTAVETFEEPIESEEQSTSAKRTGRQWVIAGVLVPLGTTVGLTAFSTPTWAWLLTGIGGVVIGTGIGIVIFPLRTVTRTVNRSTTVHRTVVTRVYAPPNPEARPFPPGQTTHFSDERAMIARDHTSFTAAFGPHLRGTAYDNAMSDLTELIHSRHAESHQVIGVLDDRVVAEAVDRFYRQWTTAIDEHYRLRQVEDEEERTFQSVDQSQSKLLEDSVGTFLETARQAIAERDRRLVEGE